MIIQTSAHRNICLYPVWQRRVWIIKVHAEAAWFQHKNDQTVMTTWKLQTCSLRLNWAPRLVWPFVCELAHQDRECNWLQRASSAQHILSCNKLWYQPVLHFRVLQPNSSFLCIPCLANVQAVIKLAVWTPKYTLKLTRESTENAKKCSSSTALISFKKRATFTFSKPNFCR